MILQFFEPLIGMAAMLIIPLAVYIFIFNKSRNFIHVLFSIAVGEYILFTTMILLGLLHLFYGGLVLTVSVAVSIVIGIALRAKTKNLRLTSGSSSLNLNFFILAVALVGFFLIVHELIPLFASDAIGTYLPWGRIISEEHVIPAFHLQNNPFYVISMPPVIYTAIAFLFSLFNSRSIDLVCGIPLLFSVLSAMMIFGWAKEYIEENKGDNDINNNIPLFTVIALMSGFLFVFWSMQVLQEPILLFFATCSFYGLFKYIKTRDDLFLALLAISSAMMILTKYSGIVFALLIFLALIVKSKNRKEFSRIMIFYLIFYIPVFIWLARNFYYFDNPVFPYLSNVFGGQWNEFDRLGAVMMRPDRIKALIPPEQFIKEIFIMIPSIVFSFIYMLRNRKNYDVRVVGASFIVFVGFMVFLAPRLLVRYLYPFLGVFALYAGIEISRIYGRIPFHRLRLSAVRHILPTCVFILLIISTFVFFGFVHHTYTPLTDNTQQELLQYLQSTNTGDVRIFTDGGISELLCWYGNYTTLTPSSLSFIMLTNGKHLYFNESSGYYHAVFKDAGIDYVLGTPRKSITDRVFEEISKDSTHFELVFDKNETKLWKVL